MQSFVMPIEKCQLEQTENWFAAWFNIEELLFSG